MTRARTRVFTRRYARHSFFVSSELVHYGCLDVYGSFCGFAPCLVSLCPFVFAFLADGSLDGGLRSRKIDVSETDECL